MSLDCARLDLPLLFSRTPGYAPANTRSGPAEPRHGPQPATGTVSGALPLCARRKAGRICRPARVVARWSRV